MRCRKVRSFLSTYCKEELTERQSARVKEHLKNCTSCRREEEILRSVFNLVDKVPRLKVSNDFNARLYQKIGQEGTSKAKTRPYFPGRIPIFGTTRLAFVATMAVAVLALGIGMNLSDDFWKVESPQMAISTSANNGGVSGELYLTVQPTDNPFLNEHKSVAEMVKQYNRWRQYSQALRQHTAAEPFLFNPGNATLASMNNGIFPGGQQTVRIRPVIRNYLIIPQSGSTTGGSGSY